MTASLFDEKLNHFQQPKLQFRDVAIKHINTEGGEKTVGFDRLCHLFIL